MEREKWIDMGKGIAILSVIFGHLSSLDSKNSIYLLVYAFHMPIFWIISGMLLSGKDYNNVSMLETIKNESKIHNVSLCNIQFNYSSLQLHRFEFELGVKKPV